MWLGTDTAGPSPSTEGRSGHRREPGKGTPGGSSAAGDGREGPFAVVWRKRGAKAAPAPCQQQGKKKKIKYIKSPPEVKEENKKAQVAAEARSGAVPAPPAARAGPSAAAARGVPS